MNIKVSVAPHERLALAGFATRFPTELGQLDAAAAPAALGALAEWLEDRGERPVARTEERRKAVRDLLRLGGYRPTGRGKPSSEYLVRAAGEGALPRINVAVDVANAVSLASGLPISVVDLARIAAPMRVDLAPSDARYVFNASGQELDATGLLSLLDAEGPCANAVKDAQRTKTSPQTRETLTLLWGPRGEDEAIAAALLWARTTLGSAGAEVFDVELVPEA